MRSGIVLLIFTSVFFGSALTVSGQNPQKNEDTIVRVGNFDRKSIDPTTLVYIYKSTFHKNVEYQIEHDFETNSFLLLREGEQIGPKDSVFNDLTISHYPYTLGEYIDFDQEEQPAKKTVCLFLKFNVFEDDTVNQGNYEICEGYEPTLYLYRSAGFGRLDAVYLGEGKILTPDNHDEYGRELNSKKFQSKD